VRKLFLALAVAAFVAVMAPAAFAFVKARVAGTYDVDATIQQNDFGIPPGTKSADVWKFTKCKRVGCKSVHLDRQGGTANAHYQSTLKKVSKGVYKGTEGPFPYQCPQSPNATFTAVNTAKLTKAKKGKATAWKGSEKVKIKNCSFATFVNYTLVGKLR
jgi:hypothetical protein